MLLRIGIPLFAALLLAGVLAANSSPPPSAVLAPEFTHTSPSDWLNSKPLVLRQLRGKPVLVEFWTFDCINCLRSIDWMKSITTRKGSALTVVTVHTPELEHEREPTNVRKALAKLGIDYPVMLDRDFSYWRAMNNQYWPAFYLIDKNGRVRSRRVGELHVGDKRAQRFEEEIEQVMAE